MATRRDFMLCLAILGILIHVLPVSCVIDQACIAEYSKYEANSFLGSGTRSTPSDCCYESRCESRGQQCYTEQNREYLTKQKAKLDGYVCSLGQDVDLALTPLSWCPGHYRFACKDPCDALGVPRCENGGSCYVSNGTYACSCSSGFGGKLCQQDLSVAERSPCDTNNTIYVAYNGFNHYTCQCKDGFAGSYCTVDVNECSSNPCLHSGTCVDHINGYSCLCPQNYTGPNCDLDAACMKDYTEHDGLAFLTSGERSTPRECCIPGECEKKGFECRTEQQRHFLLTDYWMEYYCSLSTETNQIASPSTWCPTTYHTIPSITCVDPCMALGRPRCENGGTCFSGNGTYTCSCPPGYGGATCHIVLDMLTCSACDRNNTANIYYTPFQHCQCKDGFNGTTCETDIDECESSPCPRGTCVDLVNGYRCECSNDFTGEYCEIECNHIPIKHCALGYQSCEGTANNVVCSRCDDSTYLQNGVCHDCTEHVTNCAQHTCTNSIDSSCKSCRPGFALTHASQACYVITAPATYTCNEHGTNNCYVFFRETLTWQEAKDVCTARNGHLFVPESYNELTYLENYLEAMRARFPNMVFWIGGYKAGPQVEWVNGIQTHMNRWRFGEPTGSYCVTTDGGKDFDWAADTCAHTNQYVCEEKMLYESTVIG